MSHLNESETPRETVPLSCGHEGQAVSATPSHSNHATTNTACVGVDGPEPRAYACILDVLLHVSGDRLPFSPNRRADADPALCHAVLCYGVFCLMSASTPSHVIVT